MKLTNLSRAIAAAFIAFAAAAVVPSFAQTVSIPVPASSLDNGDRATIGINATAITTDITNITNEVGAIASNPILNGAGAVGSFATAPGATVAITNFYIPYHYTTVTTTALYDPAVTVDEGVEQEPVGACVYGMGNNIIYNNDGVDGRSGPGRAA